MKRPFVLLASAMIAGVLIGSVDQNGFIGCFFAILLFSILLYVVKVHQFKKFFALVVIIFYLVGWAEITYLTVKNLSLYKDYNEKLISVEGVVLSEPVFKSGKTEFVAQTKSITQDNQNKLISGKIIVSMKKGSPLPYGTGFHAEGRLILPSPKRNPGGFDFKQYLLKDGISAILYTEPDSVKRSGGFEGSLLVNAGLRIREKVVNIIKSSLAPQQAGLLNGMLIGYSVDLTPEVKDGFRNAGLTHIMVVSGANIAFLVIPILFVLKRFRIQDKYACGISIVAVCCYTFVVGVEPSVLRASIMAIVVLLGRILMRKPDFFNSIALSSVIMMIINPFDIFDIGFMLSYLATIAIVLLSRGIMKRLTQIKIPKIVAEVLSVTIAAQIGVLPILIYFFNQVSIISLISNLLVVPLTGVITVVGMLMAFLGLVSIKLSILLGFVNYVLLSFVLVVTKLSAEVPFATITIMTPSLHLVVLYYLSILYFIYIRKKINQRNRWKYEVSVVSFLIMTVIVRSVILPKQLEITFLDVGSGDSILIRTAHGKTVLLDGGGKFFEDSTQKGIGESIVNPFLLDEQIGKLDMVIGTHAHLDHVQGLYAVLDDFEVESLLLPGYSGFEKEVLFDGLIKKAKKNSVKVIPVVADNTIKLDNDTMLTILNPSSEEIRQGDDFNDTSIVIKLNYGKVRILFCGDMEKRQEEKLMTQKIDLKADVIKVGHHGSITSTSEAFLKEVQPSVAVISVGKDSYDNPSNEVIRRLVSIGTKVYRTDVDGAVQLMSDGTRVWGKKTK